MVGQLASAGQIETTTLPNAGGADAAVLSFDRTGTLEWARVSGTAMFETIVRPL